MGKPKKRTGKARRKLGVKKQPIRDLDAGGRGRKVKGGINVNSPTYIEQEALLRTSLTKPTLP